MNGHITLVCRVVYANSTNRTLASINIFAIEADSPNDEWQVIKYSNCTLSFYDAQDWFRNANHNVEVRRLITN